jgi:anti-sigma factor ChrR (cupin superfamily)
MLKEKPMVEASPLAALASRFVDTESLPWVQTGPGSKMKVIYHDPASGLLTILAKLEPGAGIPAHVHEDLEQTFVL